MALKEVKTRKKKVKIRLKTTPPVSPALGLKEGMEFDVIFFQSGVYKKRGKPTGWWIEAKNGERVLILEHEAKVV